MAKHTRQIEEKNSELRELKVELDRERMEKQFLAEENTRVKNERRRLEADKSDLLIRVRDLTDGCRSHDNSAVDSDLSEQYHTLLQEHKEQEKYLATVQQQLYQVRPHFYHYQKSCPHLNFWRLLELLYYPPVSEPIRELYLSSYPMRDGG